jgi:hypothetical protein
MRFDAGEIMTTHQSAKAAETEATTEALVTYLRDHLAGAEAALSLLEHEMKRGDPSDREFFAAMHVEISKDRAALQDILNRFDTSPDRLRQLGGWLSEKALRFKLFLDDPSGGTLKEFEALELLALGILGKRSLWLALRQIAPARPELASFDFRHLEQRAEEQHARVERRRLLVARRVLTPNVERVHPIGVQSRGIRGAERSPRHQRFASEREQLPESGGGYAANSRNTGGRMWSTIGGLALVTMALAILVNAPDIRRYLRISTM